MMYLELKQEIINWLIENDNQFQRTNSCKKHFKQYIYNDDGDYCIGGKDVSEFINKAEELLFN